MTGDAGMEPGREAPEGCNCGCGLGYDVVVRQIMRGSMLNRDQAEASLDESNAFRARRADR